MQQFDERRFERHLASNPDLAFAECWYWIRKLQARFLPATMRAAIEAAYRRLQRAALDSRHRHLRDGGISLLRRARPAAFCDSAPAEERPQHVEALAAHHRQLEVWAENCPENFENRAALVGAEIARLEGRELDAERLYEQAIRSARDNGFVHNEALAYELAARFYAARGFETDRACVSAKRPVRLSALGSRRQGAATR